MKVLYSSIRWGAEAAVIQATRIARLGLRLEDWAYGKLRDMNLNN